MLCFWRDARGLAFLFILTLMIVGALASVPMVRSAETDPSQSSQLSARYAVPQIAAMNDSNVTETFALGALPEEVPEEARLTRVTTVYEAMALPTHFDWRQQNGNNWMTPVKNQVGCGSCVAFGAVGALEGQLKIQMNNPSWNIDLSEQHLFSCGGGNCSMGWYLSTALNHLQEYGTPDESCSPYRGLDVACSNSCPDWQARAYKIASWNWVSTNLEAIEAALQSGPLPARFDVYTDFFSYSDGVYHHISGSLVGGHVIVIVGYDSVDRYWIVKNSWGSRWGENGYFRIGFGEARIEQWVVSIRASDTVTYSISFHTNPSTLVPPATILADGSVKANGATETYVSGARVHVTANLPSGVRFSYWQISGASLDNASSADTYLTVSGNGSLEAHFTPDVQPGQIQMIIRGADSRIYYMGAGWVPLPGTTIDSPAAARCADRLHVTVRGTDNGIYYGYVTLSTSTFSGWEKLPGATPSAPALTVASDCTLYLSARGRDNGIYLNALPANGSAWIGWQRLPGASVDSPALTVAGSVLHFAVRGLDGASIYHGMMDRGNMHWLGWSRLPGTTSSKPAVAAASATEVYLTVRGTNNRIYVNKWDGGAWTGWSTVPTGATPNGPSMMIVNYQLYLAVQGTDNGIYWCSQNPSASGWSSWIRLPGATSSSPALTS